MQKVVSNFARALIMTAAVLAAGALLPASAQTPEPAAIAEMLRNGGYTLIMRHASAPQQPAAQGGPGPRGGGPGGGPRGGGGNAAPERQLDENGRAHATAIGFAFRELGVPIGEVLTSPTLRARQTVDRLGYDADAVDALGPGGDGDWMRSKAAEALEDGTNRLMITHAPNVRSAFGDAADGMEDAETLVVVAENGDVRVVGRLTSRDWARLAVGDDGA